MLKKKHKTLTCHDTQTAESSKCLGWKEASLHQINMWMDSKKMEIEDYYIKNVCRENQDGKW